MPQTLTQPLAAKAREIEAFVQAKLIDRHGVVYASINEDTMQPWTAADIAPTDDYLIVPGYTTEEMLNYENSGMTTGAYLASQSYRYRVTGEAEALAQAGAAFRGLCHIYDIGRELQEGFFPKAYGDRFSPEISTDQYLYAIKGMMAYLHVAPPEDEAAIRCMVPKMVDFWVERGYRYDYFGINDMLWPLGRFPSLLLAAHNVSGDERYLTEARRINREEKAYLNPVDSQILIREKLGIPFTDVEKGLGGAYVALWIHECAAMDIMEIDECLQHSDDHREDWLRSMAMSWKEGKMALVENGMARAWTVYNPATGEVSTPALQQVGEPVPGDDSVQNWSHLFWIHGALSSRSTMLARVGVHVAKWLPAENAAATVQQILADIPFEWMRHYIDPDGQQILEKHRFLARQVDGDAITNWLWAYWQGRYEGVIAGDNS